MITVVLVMMSLIEAVVVVVVLRVMVMITGGNGHGFIVAVVEMILAEMVSPMVMMMMEGFSLNNIHLHHSVVTEGMEEGLTSLSTISR